MMSFITHAKTPRAIINQFWSFVFRTAIFRVVPTFQYLPTIHFLDKTRYSAFAATDLNLRLRERKINEVHLVGVCTDICVLHTAIDAYNNAFDIVIPKDCVASFNQIGHDWALAHFQNTLAAYVV